MNKSKLEELFDKFQNLNVDIGVNMESDIPNKPNINFIIGDQQINLTKKNIEKFIIGLEFELQDKKYQDKKYLIVEERSNGKLSY